MAPEYGFSNRTLDSLTWQTNPKVENAKKNRDEDKTIIGIACVNKPVQYYFIDLRAVNSRILCVIKCY